LNQILKLPKVSVCVITYNHEKHIHQCLQSILDQEVDFDFEVIVGDDFSIDSTSAIVEYFTNRYPLIIRSYKQPYNTGGTKNLIDICAMANGEYIAHCDGDDFWLPGKLNDQILFLEKNPNVSGVFTNALVDREMVNPVRDFLVKIETSMETIFTRSLFIRSSFVERRYHDKATTQYVLEHNKIFDFEFYFVYHRGRNLMIMGRPYVCYCVNQNGISRSQNSLVEYNGAINRLVDYGLSESTYKAMLVDLNVSKYLTNPSAKNKVNVLRYLSLKNKKFTVFIKLILPHFVLKFLVDRRRRAS
jgi:glycosyltransferase involved in cell wall biosynthesis